MPRRRCRSAYGAVRVFTPGQCGRRGVNVNGRFLQGEVTQMNAHSFPGVRRFAVGVAVALTCGAAPIALADGGGGGPAPLASVAVPQPIGGDIVNQAAAVRLGKALFWDIQLGGDGQIACATCHFHAGADNRVINTVNPGPNGIFEIVAGPGATFLGGNVNNDDRVGSQGIVGSIFQSINDDPTVAADNCTPDQTAPFFANRRVTGRNTPPIVAAAFNR